ncbi:putative ankyrin repeat protein [Botrytis fragariae]|uniref:Putative ankyrin repeat protein n=1 Tax=Botrytis fragariae TaxID=1964551 RepID=A0A8H6AWA9_9HELO|nr:putative ankyrin repeat protein [Botrytis fragariae]KAF5874914.1 putative ankyrin repeat protein [Botrytis fragariae]
MNAKKIREMACWEQLHHLWTKIILLPTFVVANLNSNNESDLHLVVRIRIDTIIRRTQCRPKIRKFLEHTLYSRVDQIFLWVTTILHILERTYLASQNDFQRIVNKLPRGLTATYERFLLSIHSEYQNISNKLLHLIVGSMRSLSLDELRNLLAIQPHYRNMDQVEEECQHNINETIQGILGPLVRISDDKVTLVHQSAKEFLQNLWTWKDNPSSQVFGVEIEKANSLLTEATMSYLLLNDFAVDKFAYATDVGSPGSAQPEDKDTVWDAFELEEDITLPEVEYTSYHTYQDIAAAHTLFNYSARYWSEHYSRSGSAKIGAFKSAFSLLNMRQNCSKNWFHYFWFFSEPGCLYPSKFDTLIAACYFGHVEILGASLARDYKHDQTITETAIKGNLEIVDALRTRIWHSMTVSIALHPLIVAARFGCLEVIQINGHIDIVKTLLEDSRVKLVVQDVNKWTSFFWAVGSKHLDIVQFSRNPETDVNHVDKRGRNVLSWAAESGEIQIVTRLLTIDRLHCQNQDFSGRDALSWAAAAGYLEVIKLLLESGKLKISGRRLGHILCPHIAEIPIQYLWVYHYGRYNSQHVIV